MVVAVPDWEARHHHVGVPDSLHLEQGGWHEARIYWSLGTYFVHIKLGDDGVKQSVEIIEHVHHLQGRAGVADRGESWAQMESNAK